MASTDKVHFDLDEAERKDKFETFAFTLKDDEGNPRRMEISDPAEMDYQDLVGCDSPIEFLRFCMSQEDRDFLAQHPIKGWRMGALLEKYLRHYRAEERVDQRKKLGF